MQSRNPQPVLGQGQALGWVKRSPWCVVAPTRHIRVLRCVGPSWPGPTQPPLPCNHQPWGARLLWWKYYLPSKLPRIVCFLFLFRIFLIWWYDICTMHFFFFMVGQQALATNILIKKGESRFIVPCTSHWEKKMSNQNYHLCSTDI